MKSFKLAFRLFYKNTVLHSLLIFQMILVFAIGASVVSEVNAIYYTKNIIRNLGNTNYAFFQTINERDLIAGSNDTNTFNTYNEFNLNIIKDKLNGKSDFITEYSLFGKHQTNNELFHLNAFDDVLLKNITIQMTNGNWFTNTDKKDGLVRFVTDCKAYNIGDIIPITIEDDTNQIKINLWVIGIAKTPKGPQLYRYSAQDSEKHKTGLLPEEEYDLAINVDGAKTIYELSMPWDSLLPDGVQPKANSRLGFSFLVNDNDGQGRRGAILFAGGIFFNKDSSLFTYINLIGKNN